MSRFTTFFMRIIATHTLDTHQAARRRGHKTYDRGKHTRTKALKKYICVAAQRFQKSEQDSKKWERARGAVWGGAIEETKTEWWVERGEGRCDFIGSSFVQAGKKGLVREMLRGTRPVLRQRDEEIWLHSRSKAKEVKRSERAGRLRERVTHRQWCATHTHNKQSILTQCVFPPSEKRAYCYFTFHLTISLFCASHVVVHMTLPWRENLRLLRSNVCQRAKTSPKKS